MACGRNRSLLRDFAGTHLPGSDRNGDISTLHHLVPLETSGGGGEGWEENLFTVNIFYEMLCIFLFLPIMCLNDFS